MSSAPDALQEAQYQFPYHYLPRLDRGRFRFHEVLSWGHEYLSYLMHVADLVAQQEWTRLIDIGCGDGRLVSILAERFPEKLVVGLDYSERAVGLARVLAPAGHFVSGDVTDLDLFPEKFDLATCIETIEHIEPELLADFIRGIRSQLKTGAVLLVTVPSTNLPLQPKHYQHFTPETLSRTLGAQFDVHRIEHLNGSSAILKGLRMLVTNRLYTVTNPVLLTAFYDHYVRRHLRSDSRRGTRLLAYCTAR